MNTNIDKPEYIMYIDTAERRQVVMCYIGESYGQLNKEEEITLYSENELCRIIQRIQA